MSNKNQEWWKEISWSADLENLPGFAETKELLLETESAEMEIPGDLFFDQLHDKIMAQVDQTSIKPPAAKLWRRYQRWLKTSVASAALVAVLLTGLEAKNFSLLDSDHDISLSDAVAHSPEIEDSVLVYQAKDDFLVDLAQENFDDLSQDKLQGLVEAALN
jgi:hypothetical protein